MVPIHPSGLIREELEARGLTAAAAARAMRVPTRRLLDVTHARRSIDAELALRLGRFLGNDPGFWLDLQGQHDLTAARRRVGRRIDREVAAARSAA